MRLDRCPRRTAAILIAIFSATPAFAHHPMGGKTPTTFAEAILSGLAHPVIGLDHLAFVLAIGIAAAMVPAGFALIAAFVAASTAGVLLHFASVGLPMAEVAVAGSVVVAGALIAIGGVRSSGLWLALAAIAGVAHGYAFGETIVGADVAILGTYLVGLAIVMVVIALAVMALARSFVTRPSTSRLPLRFAGVAMACIGLATLIGTT